jgi:hypothetical protein
MSQTIGIELQRVMGQHFSVLVQELSSAYAGCLMVSARSAVVEP